MLYIIHYIIYYILNINMILLNTRCTYPTCMAESKQPPSTCTAVAPWVKYTRPRRDWIRGPTNQGVIEYDTNII